MEEQKLEKSIHEKLYGPYKDILKQHCKSFCTKDSVKDALFSGEYKDTSTGSPWISSTKESYKGDGQLRRKLRKRCQDTTNFVLGFDEPRYAATTEDYKWHKDLNKPGREITDQKTNIPAFYPSLLENEKLEDSVYQTSYAVDPKIPRPIPKPHSERRKHTNDLRETHFKLGTWDNVKTSETNHSLSFSKVFDGKSPSSKKKDIYASRVFRDGDWNRKDRKSVSKSITRKDFLKLDPKHVSHSLTYEHQFTEKEYHRATHFKLGSVNNTNGSLYQKDFTNSTLDIQKQPIIPQFQSLNLFPSNQDTENVYTKETSSKNNNNDIAEKTLSIRKERMASLKEVKKRHCLGSIPLSCKTSYDNNKILSMTTSAFPKPPTANLESKVDIPIYDHLNGNYYGAETKTSEARESYVPHKSTSKQVSDECRQRRQDNKSTHFVFGTDILDDQNSEQASQFQHQLPVDPSIRAAGKGLPQKKKYPHIFPHPDLGNSTEQGVQDSTNGVSVMKDHYKDPKSSELNLAMQKNTIKTTTLPDDYNTHDTHFFHTDHDFQGTQQSTTRRDFISPVRMFSSKKLTSVYID